MVGQRRLKNISTSRRKTALTNGFSIQSMELLTSSFGFVKRSVLFGSTQDYLKRLDVRCQ